MTPDPDNQALRADLRSTLRAASLTAALKGVPQKDRAGILAATWSADEIRTGMAADAMLHALKLWDRADAEAARGDMEAFNATMGSVELLCRHALSFFPPEERGPPH